MGLTRADSTREDKEKHYFALRDEAASYSGYSRVAMHEMGKASIFPRMADDISCFHEDYHDAIIAGEAPSIKWLTDKGLDIYTEAFRDYCFDNFNIAL